MSLLEKRIVRLLQTHTITMTRCSLGVIFVWFGLLKFCPGLCDVELLAQKTMVMLTFGRLSPHTCITVLAVWECAMGLAMIVFSHRSRTGAQVLRVCAVSMLVHLAGTFVPLALFPAETWKHLLLAPTLAGQYILKNVILITAVMSVAAATYLPRAAVLTLTARRPQQAIA